MSEIPPLPQHHESQDAGTGRVVLWFVLFNVAFWPRLFILGFWIFSDTIGNAFSGWVVIILGFLLLPWTTLLYAWMWAIDSNSVTGWEWIIVAIGLLSDLFFWIAGRASMR
ncbi:hypothetical protein [Solirubrobacter soli]|uniref:hypothetical protein n=1 Tax=Solirubrobacter soli TaxID=363832 RepID=UPI0004049240|nr:hypothetical protein [Solirubrobacter soli]